MLIFRLRHCLNTYQPIEEYGLSCLDHVEISAQKRSDSKHASNNRIKGSLSSK